MIALAFEGGRELADALKQLTPRVAARLQREGLEEAAEPMRRAMGAKAPRRPPHPDMADQIVTQRVRGTDAQEVAIAVGPAKRFFYGSFQEFGTVRHGAQPFARPAFDENWQKSLAILGAAMWRELAGRGVRRGTVVAPVPVQGEEV